MTAPLRKLALIIPHVVSLEEVGSPQPSPNAPISSPHGLAPGRQGEPASEIQRHITHASDASPAAPREIPGDGATNKIYGDRLIDVDSAGQTALVARDNAILRRERSAHDVNTADNRRRAWTLDDDAMPVRNGPRDTVALDATIRYQG